MTRDLGLANSGVGPHLRLPNDGAPAEATIQTEPPPRLVQAHFLSPGRLGKKILLQITQTLYPAFKAQFLHFPRAPGRRRRTPQTRQRSSKAPFCGD